MKNYLLVTIAVIVVSMMLSCNKQVSSNMNSTVTVVYGCTPQLDNVLNIVENGQFKVGMGYSGGDPNYLGVGLTAQNADITFWFGDTLFAEAKETIDQNSRYALFFGGQADNPCKLFVKDSFATPPAKDGVIRFVNLSADSISYNCYVNGALMASALAYQSITTFRQVQSDSFLNIRFTDVSNSTINASIDSVQLVPGGIRTIILRGSVNGSGIQLEMINEDPVLTL